MPKKIKKKSWKPEPKDWKGCQKRFVEAKRLLRDIFVSTPTDFYLRRLYTKRACLALLVQSIAQKLKGNGNVRQFQTSVDISVPPFVCSMWFSWAHIYKNSLLFYQCFHMSNASFCSMHFSIACPLCQTNEKQNKNELWGDHHSDPNDGQQW